jgi:cellulose synthase/poly-beta-1,6-N-acetylglucosamine synthase-like glycosyltransferase
VLYPIIIKIISLFFKKRKHASNSEFTVSILISAYNEEKVIKQRLNNIANLDYDFTKIEVLVGSDCSTDRTNEILEKLKNIYPWLSVYLFMKRRGKVSVLNDLVRKVKNEILLFTDANTVFDKNSINQLIPYFNDPAIGGVSGRLKLIEREVVSKSKSEEKKYWEYETIIKKLEGRCGVLIGANGGIFAIKRNLFKEIPLERPVTDDLFISLSVLQQNYQFVYESNAIAYEEVAPKIIDEFKRKVRFGSTNFHTLLYFKNLLFNKNILLSYSLWAHKVMRWLTPLLLILIFLLNIALFKTNVLFQIFLIVQLSLCFLSGLGFLLRRINIYVSPLLISFYFLLTNAALLVGLFKFLFRKQTAFWQSTPR